MPNPLFLYSYLLEYAVVVAGDIPLDQRDVLYAHAAVVVDVGKRLRDLPEIEISGAVHLDLRRIGDIHAAVEVRVAEHMRIGVIVRDEILIAVLSRLIAAGSRTVSSDPQFWNR